jgi:hypothetical protein
VTRAFAFLQQVCSALSSSTSRAYGIYATRHSNWICLALRQGIALTDFTFPRPFCSISVLCALSYNNALFSALHQQASTLVSRYRYIHRGKATLLVRDEAIHGQPAPGLGSKRAIRKRQYVAFAGEGFSGGQRLPSE